MPLLKEVADVFGNGNGNGLTLEFAASGGSGRFSGVSGVVVSNGSTNSNASAREVPPINPPNNGKVRGSLPGAATTPQLSTQEFKVVMGVEGMEVKPLGDMSPDTGHHHLLVNAPNVPEGEIVPVDKPEQYKHFGKGQTETSVKLAPGKYTLTLQFADGAHRSYGERMRKTISVTVQ